MKKEKYVLSSTCQLLRYTDLNIPEESFPQELAALKEGNCFILEKKGDRYLINATIKHFLQYFEELMDLESVIRNFARKARCDPSEIEAQLQQFFHQMVHKKILISEAKFLKEEKEHLETTQQIAPNTIIANYQFEKRIFANQKIEIYKGLSLRNRQTVAIKMLKKKSGTNNFQKSFAQEFSLLQELSGHPHICQFIELVEAKEQTFGVLEFVEGLPGRKFINKKQADLFTKIQVLSQFFDAMNFIHQKQILHGDLHLSNLLIDENNYLRIIDFNMSNRANPQENEIIREGGVYQYIAPEKVDNQAFRIVNSPASFESEVYQMGIIAFFFLYEKMPFEAFTWKTLGDRIVNQSIELATTSPKGVFIPAAYRSFVQKMLSKQPEKRFPRANILFQQWKKLIRQHKIDTETPMNLFKSA